MNIIRVQKSTVLLLAGIVVLGTGVATAQASMPAPNHKVTLCHRTGSATGGNMHNGYSLITVDIASVANAKSVRGHDSHYQTGNGPDGGDIIPSYTYKTFTYPGKNLEGGGAAFLARGCKAATIPPTTIPPTTIPPTTIPPTTIPPTTIPPTTIPPTTIPPTTIPPTTIAPVTVGGAGAGAPPAAKPPVSVLGTGAVAPAAKPPVSVLGTGAAANPLPMAASAGEADTGGQLVAGGLAAFAGFLMLVAGFVLRRRHGDV